MILTPPGPSPSPHLGPALDATTLCGSCPGARHSPALGGGSQRITPPPLPAWHPPELAAAPRLELETGMGALIAQGMFGEEDGQIQWYGVIASTNMSRESWPRGGGPPGYHLAGLVRGRALTRAEWMSGLGGVPAQKGRGAFWSARLACPAMQGSPGPTAHLLLSQWPGLPVKPSTARGSTTTTGTATPTWLSCSPTPSTPGPGPCPHPGRCLWAQTTAAGPATYVTGGSGQAPGIGEGRG